jgi:hypothetical protein
LARTAIGATVTWQPVFDVAQMIYAEGIEVEVAAVARPNLHLVAGSENWDPARVPS